jgi:hypothetical protein
MVQGRAADEMPGPAGYPECCRASSPPWPAESLIMPDTRSGSASEGVSAGQARILTCLEIRVTAAGAMQ